MNSTPNNKCIYDYLQTSKPQRNREKRDRKLQQKKHPSSNKPTQLSLLGWLLKDRPRQHCKIATLPKNMLVNIYSYLRVSEILVVEQCCFYFHDCAKRVWNSSEFFGELQTEKLSTNELKKLIEKSSRLSHIKTLKSIYSGKNLKAVREKIKLKICNRNDHNIKPLYGNLLEVFEVAPKNHKSSAFLMDNHLSEIVSSSYRSLLTVKLHLCLHIKKFADLSKCTGLTTLEITGNLYFGKDDLRKICKQCQKIKVLDLSGCSNLDQTMFPQLAKLENLEKLTLRHYNQFFGDLSCFHNLTQLSEVNIEGSWILDSELITMAKFVQKMARINISGCQQLTDFSLKFLKENGLWKETRMEVHRTNFSQELLQHFHIAQ